MKYDVFISYSSVDQKIAEGVCAYLEQHGVRCFVAYRDIPRSKVWAGVIVEALEQSHMMIVLFSKHFNKSEQVEREIELAAEQKMPILTFRLSGDAFSGAKKYYLQNLNWIDAFPNPERYFESLRKNVFSLLGKDENVVVHNAKNDEPVIKKEQPIVEKKPSVSVFNMKRWLWGIIASIVAVLIAVFSINGHDDTSLKSEQQRLGAFELELHEYDSILRNIVDIPLSPSWDIQTTINIVIQNECEKVLSERLENTDGISGKVIIMEVETGDIKALVNLDRTDEGICPSKDFSNCLYEINCPGSIFKTVALAAAFEDKLITPYDSVPHHNKSHIFYGKKTTTDTGHYTNGTSKYSVIEVMEQSSNIGMGEIINSRYKNNPQKFIDRLKKMGVNDTYDILVGARSPKIKTPKDPTWSMMDLVSMSFGYVVETTPLNMLTFYNTIANSGKQMKPRLVKRIIKDGAIIKDFEPEVLREEALSPQTVKDLKMILYEVVNDKNGTGKKVKSDKFQIAGKTGTARIVKPGFGYNYSPMRYLLSFCGYFPADAPKYSCIVQIIKVGPGSGGGTSGVVLKDVAERIMAKIVRFKR